jgi:phosphatidylserine decarboxylase
MEEQVAPSPTPAARSAPEPLPANITSVQPGGGVCYQLELAWGAVRRWCLKRFRPGYVVGMAGRRRGDTRGAPHEILDPRDLKYCRNLCTAEWLPSDDPFHWRERIPFARWGLAELQIMGWPLLAATIGLALTPWWYTSFVPGIVLALIVYFFRDPPRRVPTGLGLIVSPADGKIVEIVKIDYDPFIGGPAVRIGIFLSIFSVHINRAPCAARSIRLEYSPGKYLNALNPRSAIENEAMWLGLEETVPPYRRVIVRQIAGAIARRIVCAVRPGEVLERGQKFGMIKLGSRTELIVPDEPALEIAIGLGQNVGAGRSVLARYKTPAASGQ